MKFIKIINSILKLVKRSLGFTFKHIIPFLKFWAIPFLASTVFYALSSYYITSDHWVIFTLTGLISISINLLAASFWVPKWIKFYEMPQKGIKSFSFEQGNKDYLRKSSLFLAGVAGPFLLAILASTLLSTYSVTAASLFSFVSIAAVFYFAYRFSFVLPAAALGEKITFKESWNQSKGYSLRFLGLVLILTLLVNLPVIIIGLTSWAMYQLEIGTQLLKPLLFIENVLVLFTNILFFGAFTIAWVDFYKMMRQGKK